MAHIWEWGEANDRAIARQLRSLRLAEKLSLDEVASRTGISRGTLSRIERGQTSPTAETLGRLSALYALTPSQLLGFAEDTLSAVTKFVDAKIWVDPETGFERTAISPPMRGYAVELVHAKLPPNAEIAYAEPPFSGMEQHIFVLEGALNIRNDGETFELRTKDTLRMKLFGETVFHNPHKKAATYLVALKGNRGLTLEGEHDGA
ncbi:MAG: XRE family transcriptional regulator [Pseudomonadota bacterium]